MCFDFLYNFSWNIFHSKKNWARYDHRCILVFMYSSVSQPPRRDPVPGPGINYTGPREILLELLVNLNVILYLSTCHTVYVSVLILLMIMP